MPYARIDTSLWRNPKVQALSPNAYRLYIQSIVWSVDNLTDGHFPRTFRALFAQKMHHVTAKKCRIELIHSQLWHVTERGYRIHDFDEYQFTKVQIEQRREANRIAQQKRRQLHLSEMTSDVTSSDDVITDLSSIDVQMKESTSLSSRSSDSARDPADAPWWEQSAVGGDERGADAPDPIPDAIWDRARQIVKQRLAAGVHIGDEAAYLDTVAHRLHTRATTEADPTSAAELATIEPCTYCNASGLAGYDEGGRCVPFDASEAVRWDRCPHPEVTE